MINLTDGAKRILDEYLQQIKISLGGCKSVDAYEVEKDVLEHIERELETAEQPVSDAALDGVLKRLGTPDQWLPAEEISWWRKVIGRLYRGPEDWRLAYLSIGLLMLTFLFPPFFILSFLFARATVAEAARHNQKLGSQRWLVYPSLLLAYIPLLLLILRWPLAGPFAFGSYGDELMQILGLPAVNAELLTIVLCLFSAGLWWFVLGIIFHVCPGLLEFLVRPFADNIGRRLAKVIWLVGLCVAVLFAAAAVLLVARQII